MGRAIALAAAVSLLWLKKGAEGASINLRYLHLDVWMKTRLIPPWGWHGLRLATQGCWVGSGKDQLHETQCSNCRAAGLSKGSETLPKRVQNHTQTSPPCLLDHSWLLKAEASKPDQISVLGSAGTRWLEFSLLINTWCFKDSCKQE